MVLLSCSGGGGGGKGPAVEAGTHGIALARERLADLTPSLSHECAGTGYCIYLIVFDEHGHKIGQELRHQDNTLNYYEYFEYDTQGKIVASEEAYEVDASDEYVRKTYTYNSDGTLAEIKKKVFLNGVTPVNGSTDVYTYSGNTTTIIHTLSGKPIGDKAVQTHSGDRLVHEVITADDGSTRDDIDYTYKNGRLSDKAGLHGTFHYVYDADGNMVRREHDQGNDGFVNTASGFIYETKDQNKDSVPDIIISYGSKFEIFEQELGALDAVHAGSATAANNGLNWGTPGSCSTCGNMLGEVNKILMGF